MNGGEPTTSYSHAKVEAQDVREKFYGSFYGVL